MDKKQQINEYMNILAEGNYFNGSVLAANKGEVILNKGYGLSSYQYAIDNTSDTKFRIGSLTKSFTAAAVLLLHQQGRLNLSDKINAYINNFPSEAGVTIHHLLSHSSGVADFTFSSEYWEKYMRLPTSLKQSVDWIKIRPLQFKPGTDMQYSNAGYLLLTALIENVSGLPYEQFLLENIFKPLQLKNTGIDDGRKILKDLASGHSVWEEVINAEYIDMSIPQGAYGMYSTAEDLYKWTEVLRNGVLLNKSMTSKMFTASYGGYGYGWFISGDQETARHSGDINGFTNELLMNFKEGLTIIVLSNINITPADKICEDISQIILNKEVRMPESFAPAAGHIPWRILIGEYTSNELYSSVHWENNKLFVTMPKKYGALYKYQIKPFTLADGKAIFKSDFVYEVFAFDLKGHFLEFVDVYGKTHILKKQAAL
ncbi:MAG: serine hydrolase domain-containing protein [Bacillota bacterium]|uniref:serine hydrolase domain-containing protein n=1 Tax=Cytobacillus firmus TaxID=1399 RepID=UPI000A607B63|nr:serine hydrolase domain-containing protein [Cytobacillus firmus]MEC1891862.1 serine hydrolase [Cytobacillus firmus]MED4449030.1 serine hydrolase [Cytobacillus firmus]MED4767898.1 serine hydrolase [Cytobacillus firmus]SUV04356.1 penicillin-binding protein [Cytobacillus firmus]